MNEVSRRAVRYCRAGAGLLVCVAAGALVSIAVANTHSGAASAAYYYQYCTTPSQYQYCSTSTSTSTTTTTTTTETKPGKGCGDKNHLHERRFECKIVIADATIKEGNGTKSSLSLTVELSGEPESVVTVDYATAPGTATSGVDYLPISGTLSFPVGVESMRLTVTVIGDKTREPNETFYVNLSNPSPNAYLGDPQGLGTIVNDD